MNGFPNSEGQLCHPALERSEGVPLLGNLGWCLLPPIMDFNKFIGISHTDDEAAVGADLSAQIRINLTKWRWILCRGDGILSGGQVEWSGAGRARCAMHYVCAYGGVPPSQDVP